MANIIDNTFFFGNLHVPQQGSADVTANLQRYIDKYEDDYLLSFLGYPTYNLYKTAPLTQSIVDILQGKEYTNRFNQVVKYRGLSWTLGSAKQSPIANYVYYHYMKDLATQSTGGGEKIQSGVNSNATSARRKMADAWNEMVTMNWDLLMFLVTFPDVYVDFARYYSWGSYPNYYYNPQGGGDGDRYFGASGSASLSELIKRISYIW